mmetsp:Transcript_40263/g.114240  ORF Transcript_40263/g.114240 Transcript_40263/m.114240 type:complete len:151 (+) Transcript_40263:545-997(+)
MHRGFFSLKSHGEPARWRSVSLARGVRIHGTIILQALLRAWPDALVKAKMSRQSVLSPRRQANSIWTKADTLAACGDEISSSHPVCASRLDLRTQTTGNAWPTFCARLFRLKTQRAIFKLHFQMFCQMLLISPPALCSSPLMSHPTNLLG